MRFRPIATVALLLCAPSCDHTAPFTIQDPEPLGPRSAAPPVRLTFNLGDDRHPTINDDLIVFSRLETGHRENLDLLIRRVLGFGQWRIGLYADVRNLLNRRNVVGVRRDSGDPRATVGQIAAMAESAYLANPDAIPHESPRYRAWADVNHDGLVSGRAELLPLFERAARDITQPLFSYGPPRLLRFGVEVFF